uniref:5'-nucleotidase n=1 Tax=Plectus sambesii TaxID=2011161 RepID=A0A914WMD8_9BILA
MEGLLSAPSIKMKDQAAVEAKVNALLAGGLNKLQVIADFDYTISRYCDANGDRCWTTHGIFDAEAARVNVNLGEKLNALKTKYLAIEFDPNMSIEDKIPHMLDWWRLAHVDICAAKFSRPILETFVRDANVQL